MSKSFNITYVNLVLSLLNNPEYKITNRKGETLYENINYSFTLEDTRMCFATSRNMSFDYLNAELDWYLSGNPSLEPIMKASKFWGTITDDGWSANSNYGKLLLHDRNLHNHTQFQYAKKCLIDNPHSKKAVLTIYNKENAFKSKDNPCTMYLQFFIRDNKLDLYVKMRSSDVWFGMPYDVPFFILVQYLMYKRLSVTYPKLEIGIYNHQSGSIHLYQRNVEAIRKAFMEYRSKYSEKPAEEAYDMELGEQLLLFHDILLTRLNELPYSTNLIEIL